MHINPRNIQMHNGIGFWMNKDGSRSAQFDKFNFTTFKVAKGWEIDGKSFRTLKDVANYILDKVLE